MYPGWKATGVGLTHMGGLGSENCASSLILLALAAARRRMADVGRFAILFPDTVPWFMFEEFVVLPERISSIENLLGWEDSSCFSVVISSSNFRAMVTWTSFPENV